MLQATQHRPYAKYENSYRPILAYKEISGGNAEPLVPNGDGKLFPAEEFGEYEITIVEPDEQTRKILHG